MSHHKLKQMRMIGVSERKKEVPPATSAALQRRGFACASTQPRLVSAATRFSSVESGVRAVD
jgi:hypothetical protein